MIEATLGRLSAGDDLSMAEMSDAIEAIIQGRCSEGEIATLLTLLRAKGETVDEVAGAAAALRRHMVPIRSRRENLLDTCGTGGDDSGTFNISTAAALVTAAAGVAVAKHGNRSASSKTGSADVLAALGVNIEATVDQVEACLEELGICFCFAPLLHPSMKHVAAVRKKLAVPTIFNMLGPLANPARAPYQLLGVGRPELRPLLAEALARLGTKRSWVVCGEDGLDEVTLAGRTYVTEVSGETVRELTLSPADFGFETTSLDALRVENPDGSARMIREVLSGAAGPARDIVVMNSAAALMTVGEVGSPREGAERAAEAIDSGAAGDLVARLAAKSQS